MEHATVHAIQPLGLNVVRAQSTDPFDDFQIAGPQPLEVGRARPDEKSSRTVTPAPVGSSRCSVRWEPMKPAPPVTMISLLRHESLPFGAFLHGTTRRIARSPSASDTRLCVAQVAMRASEVSACVLHHVARLIWLTVEDGLAIQRPLPTCCTSFSRASSSFGAAQVVDAVAVRAIQAQREHHRRYRSTIGVVARTLTIAEERQLAHPAMIRRAELVDRHLRPLARTVDREQTADRSPDCPCR